MHLQSASASSPSYWKVDGQERRFGSLEEVAADVAQGNSVLNAEDRLILTRYREAGDSERQQAVELQSQGARHKTQGTAALVAGAAGLALATAPFLPGPLRWVLGVGGLASCAFAMDRGLWSAVENQQAERLLDPAREGGCLHLQRGDAAGLVPSILSYRSGWLHGDAPAGWGEPQVLARGVAGAPRDSLVVVQL
ncbi:MAG: hypothetical protein HY319_04295 [Armatimonadetes bacterium]|nr:hypothetical protein [Armatimonadota bacterium]